MNLMPDGDEQDVSKIVCVRDKEEQIRVTVGLLVTVFFQNQLTRSVRQGVAEVAQDYLTLVGEDLRWAQHPSTMKMHPIRSGRVKLPKDWLPGHPDGEQWEFGFHGGETGDSASAFQLDGYGGRKLGFLSMSFPMLWFSDRSDTFPGYVLRLCKALRPLSGYGGLGVLEPLNLYSAEEYQSVVRPIAERFPGLEIESRAGHTIHLTDGIKGVNWLTILGERWIDQIGGADYLRLRLGEPFFFYPYDGGLIIQAGPKLQVGDAKENRWPQHYVKAAKVLKKIQIKDHYPMHFAGEGRLDREATRAWIFRFDDR